MKSILTVLSCCYLTLLGQLPLHAADLVLASKDTPTVPIIVFKDAPPFTRRAASELSEYIGKISGTKPEVMHGLPDPVPEHAIWVGFQPKLKEIFPTLDFDFNHPEGILISCDGKNLVIAGRDRWDPKHMTMKDRKGKDIVGVQQEYGTVNAVHTFLQDQLGVRWLWPGELGEDIVKQATLRFQPFTVRYHPRIRGRQFVFMVHTLEKGSSGGDWTHHQRLQLDSLFMNPGHPFDEWWDHFHETHPKYFALKSDGTRSTSDGRTVKLCKSNPAVWEEWMRDVESKMATYPDRLTFGANANDGWTYGYCTCEKCRAWDAPGGAALIPWGHKKGTTHTYPAMADRQINFANTLARKLRERFPGRDDPLVSALAYGASRTSPVAAKPDANVIVAGVWSFHNQPNEKDRESFVQWSKIAPRLGWRPNLTSDAGWKAGFPNSAPRRVIEDLRFAAKHGVVSLAIDLIFDSWANQGPHYYMLAQMTWNPDADGEAILTDYYQRAFGPAAKTMTGYWEAIRSTPISPSRKRCSTPISPNRSKLGFHSTRTVRTSATTRDRSSSTFTANRRFQAMSRSWWRGTALWKNIPRWWSSEPTSAASNTTSMPSRSGSIAIPTFIPKSQPERRRWSDSQARKSASF
jgi:hypothetical protein